MEKKNKTSGVLTNNESLHEFFHFYSRTYKATSKGVDF